MPQADLVSRKEAAAVAERQAAKLKAVLDRTSANWHRANLINKIRLVEDIADGIRALPAAE